MEDKYTLIQKVVNTLNKIKVSGYDNLNALLGSIQALSTVADMLKAEDKGHQEELDELRAKIMELTSTPASTPDA